MRTLSLAFSLVAFPSWLLACSEAEPTPSLRFDEDVLNAPDLQASPDTQADIDTHIDTDTSEEDTGPNDTSPDTLTPPSCLPGTYLEADTCLPCPEGYACDGGDAPPRLLDRCQELWQAGETVPEGCCELRTGAIRLGPTSPLAPSDKVCILVDGALFIEGPFSFSTPLTYVRGPLEVSNLSPEGLLALQYLKRVTGHLSLVNNPELTNLQGLGALGEVGGTLLIKDNPSLISLEGLSQLQWAGGLELDNQRLLETLEGLAALKHLPGELKLTNTVALRSLSALALETSPKGLHIHNAGLEDLAVLQGVSELDTLSLSGVSGVSQTGRLVDVSSLTRLHTLEVLNSTTLESLDSFENLQSLHTLRLEFNSALSSLQGLQQLPGLQVARLLNNAHLCEETLASFLEEVAVSVLIADHNGQAAECAE